MKIRLQSLKKPDAHPGVPDASQEKHLEKIAMVQTRQDAVALPGSAPSHATVPSRTSMATQIAPADIPRRVPERASFSDRLTSLAEDPTLLVGALVFVGAWAYLRFRR